MIAEGGYIVARNESGLQVWREDDGNPTSAAIQHANVTGAVAGMSIRPPMHRVFCRLPAGFLPSPRVAEADRAIADRETTACLRWRLWEGSGRRRRAPRVAKPWQCG